MPVPRITDPGPPITPQQITKLEAKLEARLPAAYRRFLLKHNGGEPEPHYFRRDAMDSFLGIHPRDKTYDIWDARKSLKEWLPAEALPIAVTAFGDFICLAIKGKNRGKVYFWDHEGAPEPSDIRAKYPEIIFNDYTEDERPVRLPTWPGCPDLTLIADSFDEFLQSFHEDEDDEGEQPESPEDPDLVLVDIDPAQFLPSIDEDEDEDEDEDLDEPGQSAGKRAAPKPPARSSSKKQTTRPRKKR